MGRDGLSSGPTSPSPAHAEPRSASSRDELAALRDEVSVLRAALAARDEFISIASHELRNPLSPVYLQVQSMLDSVRADPESVDAAWLRPRLEAFARRLDEFLSVLDRILDVSRVSAGRLQLELEDVDFGELVGNAIECMQRPATVAGSEIRLHVESGVVGRWDRLRLEQIVTNLLSNAIRYGAGKPIDVLVRADGASAELVVRDRGVGIADRDLSRIFVRFERAGARQRGGFGVGLWLIDKLCAAMGGTVHVQSRVGVGSTFTVRLPRKRP